MNTRKSASITVRFPAALMARVRAFAKGTRCTPSAALRMALARGLKLYEDEAGPARVRYEEHLDKDKGDGASRVYFIRAGESERIKIGFCKGDPHRRLRQLQVSSPERLHLLLVIDGSQKKEKSMHRRFAAQRVGGEWFCADETLLGFIEEEKKRQAERITQLAVGE